MESLPASRPLAKRPANVPRGFTLVEMLVVIAIIGILAAILIPATNAAIRSARRAANAYEIADLQNAIGTYASANGGLNPPSFGEQPQYGPYAALYPNGWKNTRLGRYVQKAYPKCSQRDIQYLFTQVADNMDQCSALHFWLASTSSDPRYPFTGATKRSYMTFEEQRLTNNTFVPFIPANTGVTPPIPELRLYWYRPRHAGESYYTYIESRHYPLHVAASLSADQSAGRPPAGYGPPAGRTPEVSVRPWLRQGTPAKPLNINPNDLNNYLNSDTYQLICAGLDTRFSVNDNQFFLRKWPCGPTGLDFNGNQIPANLFVDDRDNQANFSEGAAVTDAPAQQ